MNRKRNLAIGAVAAVISCLLVYGVYMLQIKQVELQKTVNVAVPKEFIKAGTMITAQLIELKPVFIAAYDERMFTSIEDVIHQEALVPLGKGEVILDWKVNKYNLLPNKEQATFQIPKEYILSLSNGIRAGDQVRIYISSKDGESRKLFPNVITVASVKSSANIEVDDLHNSNLLSKANGDKEQMYASRREANGPIDQINLNLTEEQWFQLDRICKSSTAKLVIAFTSSSIMND